MQTLYTHLCLRAKLDGIADLDGVFASEPGSEPGLLDWAVTRKPDFWLGIALEVLKLWETCPKIYYASGRNPHENHTCELFLLFIVPGLFVQAHQSKHLPLR